MATANPLASLDNGIDARTAPLVGSPCSCLAEFFRAELQKHRDCLDRQREYYSEDAIEQAEVALTRIMEQIEYLCQREDACEVIAHLLRKFDVVTKLSAWTEVDRHH